MRERRISIDLNSLEILDIAYIHSIAEATNFRKRAQQDSKGPNREIHIITAADGLISSVKLE